MHWWEICWQIGRMREILRCPRLDGSHRMGKTRKRRGVGRQRRQQQRPSRFRNQKFFQNRRLPPATRQSPKPDNTAPTPPPSLPTDPTPCGRSLIPRCRRLRLFAPGLERLRRASGMRSKPRPRMPPKMPRGRRRRHEKGCYPSRGRSSPRGRRSSGAGSMGYKRCGWVWQP